MKLSHAENKDKGSAIIMMLLTMAIFIIATSAAITISFINSSSVTSITKGDGALRAAESGVEEALVRLIRSSTYGGESLTIDYADVTITVTTSGPQSIIVSEAQLDDYIKEVEVITSFSEGSLTINSWKEID